MIQDITDHLHLRQNEPAGRRRQIDRHDQNGDIAGLKQVADNGLGIPARRRMTHHGDF